MSEYRSEAKVARSGDVGVSASVHPQGAPTSTVATAGQLPCRDVDPDLFFAELPADVERAKGVCEPCPLRAHCLDEALARNEPWGVWGGQLVVAGAVVARKRPRGRPRKNVIAA